MIYIFTLYFLYMLKCKHSFYTMSIHPSEQTYIPETEPTDEPATTLFGKFCYRGDFESVRNLLVLGTDINIPHGRANFTPLHLATMECNLDIVQFLIEHGSANIDPRSNVGWTPLMLAVSNGFFNMVKYLVMKDADVNATCKLGQSVLSISDYFKSIADDSNKKDYINIFNYLQNNGAKFRQYEKETE